MALSSGLPVSRLVSVQVSLTTPAVIAPAINTVLLLGTSDVIDATERMRRYASIAEVNTDFLTTSEESLAATIWFSQNPRPDNIMIGRWFKTAGAGRLTGQVLTPTQQLMATWTAITTGGFAVQIDGGAAQQVANLNFTGMTNLNAVAAAITTGLAAKGTMVWNDNYDRFELRSATTGSASAVSFLTAPAAGTDISGMLGMQVTSSGAYASPGKAVETALLAATTIDSQYSSQWYALVCPTADDTADQQLAAYVEACDPPHYYGVTTQDPATLVSTSTTEIAYILSHFGYNKSAVEFSTTSPYAIMSYLGRILTTQWGGQNTTITLMYKKQPGIPPENLTTQQANTLQTKHCNVFVGYANTATLTQYGVSCSGEYSDTIIGADALAAEIQTAIFNVLYTTPTKVPQTDSGMQMLLNAATARCAVYVANGYLAAGTWNAPGFGILAFGDLLTLGFYVSCRPCCCKVKQIAQQEKRRSCKLQRSAREPSTLPNVLIFVNQ
jgi:hypothetical protein